MIFRLAQFKISTSPLWLVNNSKPPPPPLLIIESILKMHFSKNLQLQAVVTARDDSKNDKYGIIIVSTKAAGNHCIANTGTMTRAEK